ncbi:ABC transporter substrate-binding protein [Rhodococcus sp. T2V]|nr:ABC transporter substrate-binding protein [Rhodococcus sp. T2V]
MDRVDPASTLTVDTRVPTASLDPTTTVGTFQGVEEASVVYDTLTRYDFSTGLYEPFVAESLTPNGDFTEWSMKLRPGIKFGNGDPLTSKDVEYSIGRWATATSPTKAYLAPVELVKVVDDLTVDFVLNRPWAGFPWILSSLPGMVVNQKVVEASGDGFARNPVGAGVGPYEPVKFAPNEEVVMRAKTDYWGGPVCNGTLRFISVPGAKAKLEAFQKGETDVVTVFDDPTVSADLSELKGVNTLNYERAGTGLGMNARPGRVFSDVRLRQAVVAALDPTQINQRAFGGDATMASTFTAPEMKIWGGVEGLGYDPQKAKQLVDEAVRDGANVHVNFLVSDRTNQEMALVVEAMLDRVGFQVDVETAAFAAFTERQLAGEFDLLPMNYAVGEDAPLLALTTFLSTNKVSNYWNVDDAQIDEAVNEVYLAQNPDETAAAMGKLQQRWNELSPTVPLWVQNVKRGFTNKVHGLALGPEGRLSFEKAYTTN